MTNFSGTSELTRLRFADRVKELSVQIHSAPDLVLKVPLDDRLIKPAPGQITDLLNSVSTMLISQPAFLSKMMTIPIFDNSVFRRFALRAYSRIYGRRQRIEEALLLSLRLVVRDISLLQDAMSRAPSEQGER